MHISNGITTNKYVQIVLICTDPDMPEKLDQLNHKMQLSMPVYIQYWASNLVLLNVALTAH